MIVQKVESQKKTYLVCVCMCTHMHMVCGKGGKKGGKEKSRLIELLDMKFRKWGLYITPEEEQDQ